MGLLSSMIRVLLCLAVVACSHTADNKAPPAPLAHTDPATLIAPDAHGILRTAGRDSPILSYSKSLFDPLCSYALIESIKVAYQVDVGAPNYQVFSGTVRRDDLEKCLAKSKEATVSSDGELLVISVYGKKAYVGWRGDAIVAGTKERVTAVLAQHDDALANVWRKRIAGLPEGKLSMMSLKPMVSGLLGVPTLAYSLGADFTGPKQYRMHFLVGCADPAAAERGKAQLATGQVPPGIEPPPAIKAGLMRAKATVSGSLLDIVIDQDTFTDVDLPTLQAWVFSMKPPSP